jgi:hypothetical protein
MGLMAVLAETSLFLRAWTKCFVCIRGELGWGNCLGERWREDQPSDAVDEILWRTPRLFWSIVEDLLTVGGCPWATDVGIARYIQRGSYPEPTTSSLTRGRTWTVHSAKVKHSLRGSFHLQLCPGQPARRRSGRGDPYRVSQITPTFTKLIRTRLDGGKMKLCSRICHRTGQVCCMMLE